MGNRGCKRKTRSSMCHITQAQDYTSDDNNDNTSDFEGTTPDSYDKLLAWMVEMAENAEDTDIGPPAVVEHLTTSAKKRRSFMEPNLSFQQNSIDSPVRQDSMKSNSSSKCSKSKEDLHDVKLRIRRELLSRQSTIDYPDDNEPDVNLSLDESFAQVNGQDSDKVDTVLINQYCESTFSRPVCRSRFQKNYSCTTYNRNISRSLRDLLNVSPHKKSKTLMTMRKIMSESRNDDDEILPIREKTVVKVLDDNLLDRNMADILFAIESLWPKIPKKYN